MVVVDVDGIPGTMVDGETEQDFVASVMCANSMRCDFAVMTTANSDVFDATAVKRIGVARGEHSTRFIVSNNLYLGTWIYRCQ